MVKNLPASAGNAGDPGLIPGSGRSPRGGCSNPLQCSYLENPHGQRSLAGYSTVQVSELDTTERISTAHMKGSDGLPRLSESPWHKADPGAEPEVSLGSWMSQVLGKFLLQVKFTQWREIGDQSGSSLGIC